MTFTESPLQGAFLIDLQPLIDERGFFARTFCQREFEAHGLNPAVAQCNLSFNAKAGTVRGLHYQTPSGGEAKLVRCIRGAIYDVIIDLRLPSATYGQYFAVELNEANRRALFIPASFAHGFQTLADETEVEYQMSASYAPERSAGFRHDDPAFAIPWPRPVSVMSAKDRAWPEFVR